MSYQIQIPQVEAAEIVPNPAEMNTRVLLSVTVSEVTLTLEPYSYYSGELFSGEV